MEIGMTKNEVEIYLALLNSENLTVNKISEKTGIYRQVCYDALERLLEKGFANYFIENGKKYFRALAPNKILDFLEFRKENIQKIIPELNKLTVKKKDLVNVEVIRGKNVLRNILRDVISCIKITKEDLLMIGVEEQNFEEEDEIAIIQYIENLKQLNLKERLITRVDSKVYLGSHSEYRGINSEYFNPNPLYIYSGKIVQVIWGKPTYAIVIENEEVFDSYRKHFELLWKIAKPLK